MTDQQVQRCTAHLELARTAMDNAELRIVGTLDGKRPYILLAKACADLYAATSKLRLCAEEISRLFAEIGEPLTDGTATNGVTAGRTIPAEQKTGSDRIS